MHFTYIQISEEEIERIDLNCGHTLCVACAKAIIDTAASSSSSILAGGLSCPFRCLNSTIVSCEHKEIQQLFKSYKPLCRSLFNAAFKQAKEDDAKPHRFTAAVQEKIFGVKIKSVASMYDQFCFIFLAFLV